jgi:hypothetical protein
MVENENATMSGQLPKRPRRPLSGATQWIVLLLALIFAVAVYVGLYPWAFFMGGNFHPLGFWRGWGHMPSATGDFLLYVEISPFTRRKPDTSAHRRSGQR